MRNAQIAPLTQCCPPPLRRCKSCADAPINITILDPNGDGLVTEESPQALFHTDTRHCRGST